MRASTRRSWDQHQRGRHLGGRGDHPHGVPAQQGRHRGLVEAARQGAVLGLAVGGVVAGLDRLFLHLPSTTSRQAGLSVGAAVISACGPVVYLVQLALT